MAQATFKIWRTQSGRRRHVPDVPRPRSPTAWSCSTPCIAIQAEQAPDLAVRWNCKAGKCGSCSAEINGKPRLMCMTRLSQLNLHEPVTVEPMRAFPPIKDLVTDVSWNFRVKKGITKFKPRQAGRARRHVAHGAAGHRSRPGVPEVHRVLPVPGRLPRAARSHKHDEFIGPRFFVYAANLEMNPIDTADRIPELKDKARHRLLQHHQVLHEGLSRAHPHHRQRHHPAQGARRRAGSTIRSPGCCTCFASCPNGAEIYRYGIIQT